MTEIRKYTEPVSVTGGFIAGYYCNEEDDIAVFKGIPYAEAERWEDPVDPKPWLGIKECFEWGPSAIQEEQKPFMCWTKEFIIEDTGYSEDCLSLNLWTKTDGKENKPVLVYIHGGANTTGGSSCEVYDGTYMAEHDVVYVNINYRVGLFGFLCHPEGIKGNFALKDQIKALEWVRDNIAQFGGDPDNVTIMGQSAGSENVQTLIASPKAEGLFDKAVAMSFNIIGMPFPSLEEKEAEGKELFGDMSVEEMKSLSADQILELQKTYRPRCVIDGEYLTESFSSALKHTKCSIITGFVSGDTMLFSPFTTTTSKEEYEEKVKEVYPDHWEKVLHLYPFEDRQKLGTDRMTAQSHCIARASGKDVYAYHFAHVMPGPNSSVYGAFHTSDVPYFLHVLSVERKDYWTEEDIQIADHLSNHLIQYVQNGDPGWDKDIEDRYLLIDDEETVTHIPPEKNLFWMEYFKDLY